MAEKMDTSGRVTLPVIAHNDGTAHFPQDILWSDLSPFEQGYICAMLTPEFDPINPVLIDAFRFSDLAPETLSAIRHDCAAFGQTWRMQEPEGARPGPGFARGEQGGRDFWMMRQRWALTDPPFPPLTPSLGDDGKVYLQTHRLNKRPANRPNPEKRTNSHDRD